MNPWSQIVGNFGTLPENKYILPIGDKLHQIDVPLLFTKNIFILVLQHLDMCMTWKLAHDHVPE
jgi:hypothetical protein